MNRSMFKTLGKCVIGLSIAFALATTNIGCHKGGCEPCKTSKAEKTSSPCPAGCTKPCCKKS